MFACPYCAKPVAQKSDTGRRRLYCSESHRVLAYRRRRKIADAAVLAKARDAIAALTATTPPTERD